MSNSFQTETILEFQNQFSHENSHKKEIALIHNGFCRVRFPYPAPKKKDHPPGGLSFLETAGGNRMILRRPATSANTGGYINFHTP